MPCAHRPVDRLRVRGACSAIALLLALSGCDTHEARIQPPPSDPGSGADDGTFTLSLIGATILKDPLAENVSRSPLPLEVPVTCLRRTADGALSRCDGDALTPLSWWQRFPADLISDPLPWTFTSEAWMAIVLQPVPVTDIAQLVIQARRDGYADADAHPPAQHPLPGTAP